MGNIAISKPEHGGKLFVSYWTQSDTSWAVPVDITNSFLTDRTTPLTTTVSGDVSLTESDIVEKFRLIMVYTVSTTLDKIYLSGITQNTGLDFDVFHGAQTEADVLAGTVPSTAIGSTQAQTVPARPRNTGNELITFSDQSALAFMVEVSNIDAANEGQNLNLIKNGDFQDSLDSFWTKSEAGGSTATNETDGTGNVTKKLSYSTGGDVSWHQQLGFTTQSAQDFTFSIDVIGGFNIVTQDLGDYRIGSTIAGGESLSDTAVTGDIGTTLSVNFSVLSGVNLEYLTFIYDSGQTGEFEFDNASLVATTGDSFIGQRLDVRGVFFGVEIYRPDLNYSYGATLDNSYKYSENNTANSHYQNKLNSLRVDNLPVESQTDEQIKDAEYLDYLLGDGYCFYQRDVAATDQSEYFLANFKHTKRTPDHFNRNTTQLTLKEAHEWN